MKCILYPRDLDLDWFQRPYSPTLPLQTKRSIGSPRVQGDSAKTIITTTIIITAIIITIIIIFSHLALVKLPNSKGVLFKKSHPSFFFPTTQFLPFWVLILRPSTTTASVTCMVIIYQAHFGLSLSSFFLFFPSAIALILRIPQAYVSSLFTFSLANRLLTLDILHVEKQIAKLLSVFFPLN